MMSPSSARLLSWDRS